jgi:uncharacterized protein (DUF488 family)
MTDLGTDQPGHAITIFTIGFAGHGAEEFFGKLQQAGVKTIFDVRLNNVSQLAGFAKRKDLEYFLRTICGIDYVHDTTLAPTKDILDDYKKKRIEWEEYEERFNRLLASRRIESHLTPDELDQGCLLCSEHEHQHCHRRLVTDYFREKWRAVDVVNL